MKKRILGMALLASMAMSAGSAMAAYDWYVCDVGRIGVSGTDDNVFKVVNCDKSAGNSKWVTITQQKDTSMATLLTARSLGSKIKIQADMAVSAYYKPLESMFLMEP